MLIDKYVRKSKFKFRKYEPLPDGDGLNAGGIFGHTPPEVNFGNILQAAFFDNILSSKKYKHKL